MDLEEVEEDFILNGTDTSGYHAYYISLGWQIYTEFYYLVCIFNLCVDALIVHIIRTFKKLQLQSRNHYIVHITVINAMYMAMLLIQRILLDIFEFYLLTNVDMVFLFGEFLFYALMTFDWVLEQYCSSFRSLCYRKTADFETLAVYLILVSGIPLLIISIKDFNRWLAYSITVGTYGLLSVLTATVSVIYCCKKRETPHDGAAASHLPLKLSTIAMLAWVTFFVGLEVKNVPNVTYSAWIICVCTLFTMFPVFKPIVNFYVLYMDDRNFRECLGQVFRCSGRSYADDTH